MSITIRGNALLAPPDVLPSVINDRYLHTNSSTGALEWSEVQSGGADVFVVTFTLSGGVYSADKTLAEINAAYTAGKIIIGKYEYNGGTQIYQLGYISSTWVEFSREEVEYTGIVFVFTFSYSSSSIEYYEHQSGSSDYSVTVTTSWTLDSTAGWYYQDIAVQGITSFDSPLVDINLSSATTGDSVEELLEMFANIFRITTSTNSIRVYSAQQLASTLSLRLKCVR